MSIHWSNTAARQERVSRCFMSPAQGPTILPQNHLPLPLSTISSRDQPDMPVSIQKPGIPASQALTGAGYEPACFQLSGKNARIYAMIALWPRSNVLCRFQCSYASAQRPHPQLLRGQECGRHSKAANWNVPRDSASTILHRPSRNDFPCRSETRTSGAGLAARAMALSGVTPTVVTFFEARDVKHAIVSKAKLPVQHTHASP
jgi:hypothetical protein